MDRTITRLGARIRSIREEKGLSREEAAHRGGIHATHWSAIELSNTNATVATLVGIAEALDVRLEDLFKGL